MANPRHLPLVLLALVLVTAPIAVRGMPTAAQEGMELSRDPLPTPGKWADRRGEGA